MKTLALDFETYCDLDIKQVGAYAYAQHPSCEVLMCAYRIGNSKYIKLWDATANFQIPQELKKKLLDPRYTITAFNAPFERLILKYVLGIDIPIQRFQCTMVYAYGMGFAGNLETVGKAVGLPQDKQKLAIGKRLLSRFCKPTPKNHKLRRYTHETHPQEWEQFKQYCIQDIVTEQAVFEYLKPYPLRKQEWTDWYLDQKINDRGLPIDIALVDNAIELANREKERVFKKMREITGLENPNSRDQLLGWLQARGLEVDNLQAATIDSLTQDDHGNEVNKVIKLKQRINKSSVSKYEALKRSAVNGRVHGTIQFMGASRTGRDAGRIFQPQNLARPEPGWDVPRSIEFIQKQKLTTLTMKHLAYSVRRAVCAPLNKKLAVSDLSGIEGVVLPWLCDFQEKLDIIASGTDMYKVIAARIFNTTYQKVNKEQRQTGKTAELACGYQGALGALNQMAANFGLEPYTEEVGTPIVKGWRTVNKPIVQFWYDTERAARNAIRNPGKLFKVHKLGFTVIGDFLFMHLPSGRNLAYHLPELNEDGQITYMGWNSFTHKWKRIHTYGGHLTANGTQGVARDILFDRLQPIEDAGFPIIFRIHDEVACETNRVKRYNAKHLSKLLATQPEWAEGLPLKAEGYEAQRFRK